MRLLAAKRMVARPAAIGTWLGGWRFRRVVLPWLFLLPITALHLTVVIGPSLSAIYYSLTDWSGYGEATFIGLDNFRVLFTDDLTIRRALAHNISWMLFFLTIPMIMALFASSLLAPVRRGAMLFRTLIFLPFVLPSVVSAYIWQTLYNPRLGINAQLEKLGLPGFDRALLGDPATALAAIAFADNWHWWGFLAVLFLTAMQSIPTDLYDAAKIDGATRWQEFRHVTLPGIRPTVLFLLMMTAIWSFLVFDYVWIMTQGGPAGSSELVTTHLFKQAFRRFEVGYATAIGLTVSVLAAIVVGFFTFLRKRGWEV